MKNQAFKLFLMFTFSCVLLTAQNTPAQEKSEYIDLNYILAKLTFTSRISKSAEQINNELIKEIRERKVDFILKNEKEKEIEKAGGNELLIRTIRENLTDSQESSDYITLDEIKSKLTSVSKNGQSKVEINKQLIKEIRKRKVDFTLSAEDSKYLRENGGSDLLIEEIHKNTSKRLNKWIEETQILYQKYTDNYRGNCTQKKIAIEAGKKFIEKYGNDKYFKPQVEYLKKAVPKLDGCEPHPPDPRNELYEKFNTAFKNKKWEDLFETGAEILDRDPEHVDVALVLASVGFDSLVENSDRKYLTQTFYYAEKSIKLLESGAKSGRYGAFEYEYKTKKFPDGRANALGWMHYFIGYIKYYHFAQREQAVLSFYKSITYKSGTRERPIIFRLIGDFYLNELTRLEKQENLQIESYPANTPERDAKTNALLERAIDAFARAYLAAKSVPETDKKTLEFIFDDLQKLLKMRGKYESNDSFDKLILNIIAKPMPDPAEIIPL